MIAVDCTSIKQLQSFERRWEWRDLTRDKLTVGIGFYTHTLPALPPRCLCIAFPRSAVRQSARIRLIRSSWPDGAADCLPSIGHDYQEKYWGDTNTTQYWQVLANTQYPNTGIVRTLIMMYFNIILLARPKFTEKNVLPKMLAQLIYYIYKSLSFAHNINTILMVHSCPFNLAPAIQRRST